MWSSKFLPSPGWGGEPSAEERMVEGACALSNYPSTSFAGSPSHRFAAGRKVAAALLLVLATCRAQPEQPQFPTAERDVAPIVGDTFSTEDARDRLGEAQQVIQLAGVRPGMWVADVGAGQGYYTVRLARVVGRKGRVLAEDIMTEATDQLMKPNIRGIIRFIIFACSGFMPACGVIRCIIRVERMIVIGMR